MRIDHEEHEQEYDTLVIKLRKDVAAAAALLTPQEARYLVDYYYQLQHYRIQVAGQVRASSNGSTEPHTLLLHFLEQTATVEKQAARVLDLWSRDIPICKWARSIVGIGPVLAAGLRAHVDNIDNCKTVSNLWSFAGLNPESAWKKGQKRPWNARLKVLCFKIGESFVKNQNRQDDVYGKLYRARKDQEIARNEALQFKDQAEVKAAVVGKSTQAYGYYKEGRLPPAHIHARARRYAVKMFLSHYWAVAYELEHGEPPPRAWILTQGVHEHAIAIPNWNGTSQRAGEAHVSGASQSGGETQRSGASQAGSEVQK